MIEPFSKIMNGFVLAVNYFCKKDSKIDVSQGSNPPGIYLFKVNNKDTRTTPFEAPK